MRIGEVAEQTGLNISNIRFYERKGLLTPGRQEESKYRDYTEADVLKVKQILLYRKMGIPVETIYLLLKEQAELGEVLRRQKEELKAQVENLQGAMELCDLVLAEPPVAPEKLDAYLNYIHQEETKGKQFAEVEELLEDMVDYTRTSVLNLNPMLTGLLVQTWGGRLISLGLLVAMIALPVLHLVSVFWGKATLSPVLLSVYGTALILYGMGFFFFRKARRGERKEKKEE